MTLKQALQIFNLDDLSSVTKEDLRSTYKKLAKSKHPDSGSGKDKDFIELQEAFNILNKYVHTESGTGKDLSTLSKEEILDKYFEDTKGLQKKITDFQGTFKQQNQIMEDIKEKIEDLINDFEAKKTELREELEKEVNKLERKYSDGIFKRLLFFIPKMTEEEFWSTYHQQASRYSKKHLELDVEFLKEMLTTYGEGLNKINQSTKNNLQKQE